MPLDCINPAKQLYCYHWGRYGPHFYEVFYRKLERLQISLESSEVLLFFARQISVGVFLSRDLEQYPIQNSNAPRDGQNFQVF